MCSKNVLEIFSVLSGARPVEQAGTVGVRDAWQSHLYDSMIDNEVTHHHLFSSRRQVIIYL